jgi:hypothetical protein
MHERSRTKPTPTRQISSSKRVVSQAYSLLTSRFPEAANITASEVMELVNAGPPRAFDLVCGSTVAFPKFSSNRHATTRPHHRDEEHGIAIVFTVSRPSVTTPWGFHVFSLPELSTEMAAGGDAAATMRVSLRLLEPSPPNDYLGLFAPFESLESPTARLLSFTTAECQDRDRSFPLVTISDTPPASPEANLADALTQGLTMTFGIDRHQHMNRSDTCVTVATPQIERRMRKTNTAGGGSGGSTSPLLTRMRLVETSETTAVVSITVQLPPASVDHGDGPQSEGDVSISGVVVPKYFCVRAFGKVFLTNLDIRDMSSLCTITGVAALRADKKPLRCVQVMSILGYGHLCKDKRRGSKVDVALRQALAERRLNRIVLLCRIPFAPPPDAK